jgi:hypothetical protein
LNGDECGDKDSEEDEESDDAAVRPGVFAAAPLKGKEKAYDARDENYGAVWVELDKALAPTHIRFKFAMGRMEKD